MDPSVYLDDKLSATQVANKLLLSTVVSSKEAVDFQPSINALKYELQEVDAELARIAAENPETLPQATKAIEKVDEQLESLQPYYEDVLLQVDRMNSEFLEPLQRTQTLHRILKKLFATAALSRDLATYMEHLATLYTIDEAISNGSSSAESLSKSAESHQALQALFKQSPDLSSLDMVSRNTSLIAMAEQRVIRSATEIIKQLTSSKNSLKFSLAALSTLGRNTEQLCTQLIDENVSNHGGRLARTAGGSMTNFEQELRLLSQTCLHFRHLEQACSEMDSSNNTKLESTFVGQLCSYAGRKLRTAAVANQVAARGLAANREKLLVALDKFPQLREAFESNIKPNK